MRVKAAPLSPRAVSDDDRRGGLRPLTVVIQPKQVAFVLGSIIAFFVVAHVTIQTVAILSGHDVMRGLVALFNLDAERNLPTLFSTALFLAGALICVILWRAGRAEGRAEIMWLILAGAFTFLGMDEFFEWHELLGISLRSAFPHFTGLLYFAWVIPYGVLAAVLALALSPYLKRLEQPVRSYLILAGVVYLIGAVGMEMLGGLYYEGPHTKKTFMWVALTTFEELCEMIGLSLLLYGLLVHLVGRHGGFSVLLTAPSTRGSRSSFRLGKTRNDA